MMKAHIGTHTRYLGWIGRRSHQGAGLQRLVSAQLDKTGHEQAHRAVAGPEAGC
jgi:hypothetical protein